MTKAHSQWLSKSRSIPYWATGVFSSTVTDWSDVRTGHFFSFRFLLINATQLNTQLFLRMNPSEFMNELCFRTRGGPKGDHHLEQFVCY
jgi:hypothetical protein